jgi:DNA-binding MltR family transcriptional regulator
MSGRHRKRAPKAGFEDVALKLVQKLAMESDRGCVLVAAAAIDEDLANALRAYFLRKAEYTLDDVRKEIVDFLLEKEPLPPLGSFAIRIRMCCVLGLITPQLYKQLKALAALRNAFAHISEPIELTDTDIRTLTNPKKWSNITRIWNAKTAEEANSAKGANVEPFSTARLQFMGVVSRFAIITTITAADASGQVDLSEVLKTDIFQPPEL